MNNDEKGLNTHSSPAIRPAVEADLAAINDIYNHYVLHSTCTYQEEPETMDDRRRFSPVTARITQSSWPKRTGR